MKNVFCVFSIVFLALSVAFADQKRFDNPCETKDMFGSVGKGDVVWNGRGQRVESDHSDSVNGDFSLVYTADTIAPKEVGFMTLPSEESWDVGYDWTLVLNMKSNNLTHGTWPVKVIDHRGGQAFFELPALVQSDWKTVEIKSSDFSPGYSRFDVSKIIAFQFLVSTGKGNKIWFDDVHFVKSDGSIIGVSEKSIEQIIASEQRSRDERIRKAMNEAAISSSRTTLNSYFAKLYLNQDIDIVNSELLRIFTTGEQRVQSQYGINQLWHLSLDSLLCRMYYTFGKKSEIYPGRLADDTEEALLELIWTRNEERNDISLAKQSTWWIVAGESSDLISKSAALLSSQIFINEPRFRDRVYPDYSTGGGYGYWFHKSDSDWQGPRGKGNYKDFKDYKAVEHYYAYLDYFKEYFRERAGKGLFIENGSSIYAQYSLMPVYDLYSMTDDEELKKLAGNFLDLYWSVWAQDQLNGIRGGARIRESADVMVEKDSDYVMAYFFMGCDGDAKGVTLSQILSGYSWPEVIWSLALDREGMGQFEFVSRLPGEEENLLPRPAGSERTLMCDTESRFVRYSWVTPEYVLGCRMDYPTAIHSYISNLGTKYGVSYSTIPGMAIFPWSIDVADNDTWSLASESGNFRTVQNKGTMVIQQARSTISVSPQWFPQKNHVALPIGIYVSPEVDEIMEKDGWIFVHEGRAYTAIRIVKGQFTADHRGSSAWFDLKASSSPYANIDKDSYRWNQDRSIIKLKDIYSPVIIDTATQKDFPTLESFSEYILDGQVALLKTVVPGWYILQYKTANKVKEQIVFEFNAANSQIPAVNGEQIDYKPAKLFESPFISSDYESGIIKVHKDDYEITLDFN
ncbi:MAG: hypothetical protein ACIAQZ_13950 [Sedimentisphaeraceae bacterium JB056]